MSETTKSMDQKSSPELPAEEILDFWFSRTEPIANITTPKFLKAYFMRDKDFDAQCRQYEPYLVQLIASPPIITPTTPPRACVAQILLLDQFSRNIWRGSETRRVYEEADPVTRQVIKDLLNARPNLVIELQWYHMLFIVQALGHSESLDDQETALVLWDLVMKAMKSDTANKIGAPRSAPGASKRSENELEVAEKFFEAVKEHVTIVQRFGRFPHRNTFLDRENTPAEEAWLKAGGNTFGTDEE